jgi:hypothetical protein
MVGGWTDSTEFPSDFASLWHNCPEFNLIALGQADNAG